MPGRNDIRRALPSIPSILCIATPAGGFGFSVFGGGPRIRSSYARRRASRCLSRVSSTRPRASWRRCCSCRRRRLAADPPPPPSGPRPSPCHPPVPPRHPPHASGGPNGIGTVPRFRRKSASEPLPTGQRNAHRWVPPESPSALFSRRSAILTVKSGATDRHTPSGTLHFSLNSSRLALNTIE